MQETLTVNVVTLKPFKENMFEEFLGIDVDFGENEDYFREDTIELGFRSEAHRLSKEFNKKFTEKWKSFEIANDELFEALIEDFLEKLANVSVKGSEHTSQFILGNQSYTSSYVITMVSDFTDYDEEITVVISYKG